MTEEGIAITFSSETFFMRTSCISSMMNSVYSIFCQSTFETTHFLDATLIGYLWHKCN